MGNIPKLSKLKTVVEVDQSGKFEDTTSDTVLAFSNGISQMILIPKKIKRNAVSIMRKLGKKGNMFYLQLFSISLYLLLKDFVHKLTIITIDEEYVSKNKDIKRILLNLANRDENSLESENINFRRIGKKSNAHFVAINCLRGKSKPNKIIKLQEILELILTKSELKKIGGSLRRKT